MKIARTPSFSATRRAAKPSAPAAKPAKPANPAAKLDQFQATQEKEWTLLFYNVGQGSMSAMTSAIMRDLERAGSDQNTNLVAANYSEPPAYQDLLGRQKPFAGALTYHLEKQGGSQPGALGSLVRTATAKPSLIASPATGRLAGPGEYAKMSDPATLKQFVLDSMKKYPAKHFALVITGHGAAFQGQAVTRGAEGRRAISNDQLGRVLTDVKKESGQGLDLVNLNTCFSANLETLYSLKDGTDVVVASEGELSLRTQPFGSVVDHLQSRLAEGKPVDARQLGTLFVEQARQQPLADLYTPTLSATDTAGLQALGASVAALQEACMKGGLSPERLREYLQKAMSVDFSRNPRPVKLADLGSLARVLREQSDNAEVQARAQDVEKQLAATVIAEQHSGKDQESLLGKVVRSLPFLVGPQSDTTGAGGLTVFWQSGETERQALIADSSYGKAHPIESFMAYLAR